MAWLPMYLIEKDVEFLNDWLNQEEEIAFLVSDGLKRWIAKKEHSFIADIGTQGFGANNDFRLPNRAEYILWHVPSGPLPLLAENNGGVKLKFNKEDWDEATVANPWLGWTEFRTGANSRIPYFGSGHPGVLDLEIKLPFDDEIPMSTFSWIGNHYRIIGSAANPNTEKFWAKLRKMAKKVGKHIPRGNDHSVKNEIYAFPTAYAEIKNGRPCGLNP